MTWLRRLARLLERSRGRHRVKRDPVNHTVTHDEQWIRDLLPPTPPPREPAEAAPWPPRITRWVRLACPLPDDTMLLSPVPALAVLELMSRGFAWDPR